MPDERFEEHLRHPRGRGHLPEGAHSGSAGGAACGDLVRFSLSVEGGRVARPGFEASGCGATIAAASAAVELVQGAEILAAARVGTREIAGELGGLSVGKLHAADLAADALHWALGRAAAATAQLEPHLGRVLVAMSGGVDSAVAATLTGPDAVAVTLELWADPDNDGESSCCSAQAVRTARALAQRMGMPHFTLDLREEFRAGVVQPYLDGHAAGVTPNPCVGCNGHVRLDAMLAFADRLGAEALATGHYARTTAQGLLRQAADPAKDQSYMLAALSPATIRRMRFPLGDLHKPRVREIAREHGLAVADKPDSQDLCFLAGTGRSDFLARHGGLRERPGEILDRRGRVLGRHRGHHGFTVGQRRGLGVGNGNSEPLYVVATDARANTVTVGPRAELARMDVKVGGLRLHRPEEEVDAVKLRYRTKAVGCRVKDGQVELAEPFEGVAPGQSAVFLSGDVVVGCATITR